MADLMVFSPSDQTSVGQVLLIDLAEVVADMDDACFCCQSHHENLSTMKFMIDAALSSDFPKCYKFTIASLCHCKGLGQEVGPRLREFVRQVETEVVSNSRNKSHKT